MTQRIHCPSCGHATDLCPSCNRPVGEDWACCAWCGSSLVGEPEAPKLLPAPQPEPPKQLAAPAPPRKPTEKPKASKKSAKAPSRPHGNRRWKITRPVQVHRDEHRWVREQAQAAGKGHKDIVSGLVAEWAGRANPPTHDVALYKNDQAMLNVGLATDEAADWYRELPNKRAVVRGIIRRAMSNKP